ncbi:MAG: A24 family peptidase [Clostridia bacterium]|nr:A24 family peptidase [Clostridia bacterium]
MNLIVYVILTIIAILCGQGVKHIEKKLIPLSLEQINYKEFFKNIKKDFKFDIKYTIILVLLFNLLYYFHGNMITTYLYMALLLVLLIVFSIDYKFQIIPDEAHICIILLSIINMIFHLNNILDYLLGALVGGGIFFIISYLSYFILKKEGMGFGDVKLMASLGLFVGVKNILVITLLSFLIGAIVGIILLIFKKKDKNSYIPFGPFIVIATIFIMFIPADYIIEVYISFCSMLGTKITDVIYCFMENNG